MKVKSCKLHHAVVCCDVRPDGTTTDWYCPRCKKVYKTSAIDADLKFARHILATPCSKVSVKDFKTWARVTAYFGVQGIGGSDAEHAKLLGKLPVALIKEWDGKKQRSIALTLLRVFGVAIDKNFKELGKK